MAKNSLRRHQVERLLKRWQRLTRMANLSLKPGSLSFGAIFNHDPIDCGNPKCQVCSPGKVLHPKEKRLVSKKETLAEIQEFIGEIETEFHKEAESSVNRTDSDG